jgi:hypothetical protein
VVGNYRFNAPAAEFREQYGIRPVARECAHPLGSR